MRIVPTIKATQVHYDLYERYINERHANGDMFPPSQDQFEKFLIHSCSESFSWNFGKMINCFVSLPVIS